MSRQNLTVSAFLLVLSAASAFLILPQKATRPISLADGLTDSALFMAKSRKARRMQKVDKQNTEAFMIVREAEEAAKFERLDQLMARQRLYQKADAQLSQAFDIVGETEERLELERLQWLLERLPGSQAE